MMRRLLIGVIALALLAAAFGAYSAPLEKPKVTIAVGGKASLYYLPLTLAERLGYFKDEGLDVDIVDFAGGAKALQAMMGGSADVVAGGYDHVIIMQARGQKLQTFVGLVATPSIALGIAKARIAAYRSPKDLKGWKIGVTAPGSSTNILLNHLLAGAGLQPDDVSIIGVGTGPTAVAAIRAGQIDAIVNVEPAITILERTGDIRVVVETMSEKGTRAMFGDLLPAGSLYTKQDFIKQNPNTVQALTNAMVRALRWLQKANPEDVAKVIPPEYMMGDRAVYFAAFERCREGYSKDGLISPTGAAALYKVLRSFDPAVKEGAAVDLAQTYDNRFVEQALQRRP